VNRIQRKLQLNPLDASIILLIVVSILGFGLAKAGHAGVNKVLKGETRLSIDVYIANLRSTDNNLFKVGDKAALTIRNQPVYPPFVITAVKQRPRLTPFLAPNGSKVVTFTDPSQPYSSDYIVTITDQAEVTTEGYVVKGNKIKVGNSIELEGFKYRVSGIVLDLHSQ
jgi:hypothetical protein